MNEFTLSFTSPSSSISLVSSATVLYIPMSVVMALDKELRKLPWRKYIKVERTGNMENKNLSYLIDLIERHHIELQLLKESIV
jgi:hypothetical protein